MAEQQVRQVNWDPCTEHAAVTDIGMRRSNNQDAYAIVPAADLLSWDQRGHVFVVADGMGAHAAGELASKLAAEGIPHTYYIHRDDSPPEAILKAIRETNAQINSRGRANTDFHNMGTTASVLLLLPQGALAAHVGDTRIYRLRGDRLDQLTFDHSLLWEMRSARQLTEDADELPAIPKNIITRSLGPHPTVQVDLEGPHPIELGDTYLLCTDGLTGKVADEELGPILQCLPPQEAAQVMVDLANLRGGSDNITVIVVRVTGPAVTTEVARAEPLTVGGEKTQKRVHPALWVVMGVCVMAGLGMLVADQRIPALLAILGGIVAAAVGILQKCGAAGPDKQVALTPHRRLGRGPHSSSSCPPNAEFVANLEGVVKELRDAAADESWTIQWPTFDRYCELAEAAAGARDYPEAIRQYAHATSFMMQQLRAQRAKQASDSSIHY